MKTLTADCLDTKTSRLLTRMLNSGDSQEVYIACILDEIASNGEGQETREFLVVCAQELANAALAVVAALGPATPAAPAPPAAKPAGTTCFNFYYCKTCEQHWDTTAAEDHTMYCAQCCGVVAAYDTASPLEQAEMFQDAVKLLAGLGITLPSSRYLALPVRQRVGLARWAALRHTAAADDAVVLPPAPYYVPPPDVVLAAVAEADVGILTGDLQLWVMITDHTAGNLKLNEFFLPASYPRAMARRVAFYRNPGIIPTCSATAPAADAQLRKWDVYAL